MTMRRKEMRWRLLWDDLKYLTWFPVYLLLYLVLERVPVQHYWDTQLPMDALIPFCEWFAIPYCLWYPLLIGMGVYLLLRDKPAYRRYMVYLGATFLLSVVIWVLLPNCQGLRPAVMPRDNLLTQCIAGLYRIDTNTNVFPSVHVVGSVGAVFGLLDCRRLRRNKAAAFFITILAVLICASTVFIKQHAVLDVFGGLALSLFTAVPVYRRSQVFHLVKKPA